MRHKTSEGLPRRRNDKQNPAHKNPSRKGTTQHELYLGTRDNLMFKSMTKEMAFLSALLFLSGIVSGCAGKPQSSESGHQVPLKPCHLSAPGSAERLPAKCGQLSVYENRADKSGRQIELHIAVIPTISRTPEPDPIFFITGGPGGASTQDFVSLRPAFKRINEKRDIILVDQRGTGQSHPLECTSPEEETNLDDEAAIRTEIENCIDQLDADTRFYTTQDAVDDLDQVRAALGYEKINLYGISYGTRVAQVYVRSYPERVRAVILDGVVPLDEALGVSVASDAQRALNAVFARCAADADCNRAFPDLPGALAALLGRVEKAPVVLTLEDPYTSEPDRVVFTRNKLGLAIRLFSYSTETVALLPLLIHDANAAGDLNRLAAQAMIVTEQLEGSINSGLHNSVVCAEDVPFYRRDGKFVGDAQAEKRSYLGESYKRLERICKYWPAAKISCEFKEPLHSDLPVLLLSGELDPVTPPTNAEHAADTLPNSLRLIAPGQGHGVLMRGCIYKVAADFIESGTVKGLGTGCIQDLKPSPFFMSYTGPKP
jgi:pimeloyl-ACP methyl ester carboxylesterase